MKQKTEGAASTGALIFGLVALAFGFAAGYVAGEKNAMKAKRQMTAVEQPSQPTAPNGLPPEATLGIIGSVTGVEGDVVIVESRSAEGSPVTYRVTLTPSTTLMARQEVTAKEYDDAQRKFIAEQEAFSERGTGEPPLPPELFRDVSVSRGDLRAGQTVSVTATEAVTGNSFTAASLMIMSQPAQAPELPPIPAEDER